VNERLEKVRERDPQKAQCIENNTRWERAIKRTQGDVVKDSAVLLKKCLKRKLKNKGKEKT